MGDGVIAGIPAYAKSLDVAFASRDLAAVCRAHGRLIVIGLSSHRFIRSKLCAGYARCGRLRDAHRLLLFFSPGSPPTFLLNSLLRGDAPGPTLVLFSQMLAYRSRPPDARSFASALRATANLTSLRIGRVIHAAILAGGLFLSSDLVLSNSLISMYSKCGDLVSARQVFDRMSRRTIVSWTAMINACGVHGRPAEAVALFERLVAKAAEVGPPDAAAMTAVLAACARGEAAEAEEGLRLFATMSEGRLGEIRPRLEHYTCMVDILGRTGLVEEAEALIGQMEGKPDDALWSALLGACRANGRLDVAERVANRFCGQLGS